MVNKHFATASWRSLRRISRYGMRGLDVTKTCQSLMRLLPLLTNVSEIDFAPYFYYDRLTDSNDAATHLVNALAPQLQIAGFFVRSESGNQHALTREILSRLDPNIVEELICAFPPRAAEILLKHQCPKLRKIVDWSHNMSSVCDLLEELIKQPRPNLSHISFDWHDGESGRNANDGDWFPEKCRALLAQCKSLRIISVSNTDHMDYYADSLDSFLVGRYDVEALPQDFVTWAENVRLGVPLHLFRFLGGQNSMFHYYNDVGIYEACLGPKPTLTDIVEALAICCWHQGGKTVRGDVRVVENLRLVQEKLDHLLEHLSDSKDTPSYLDPLLPLLEAHAAALLFHKHPSASAALERFKTALEQSQSTRASQFFKRLCDERLPGGFEGGWPAPEALLCALLEDVDWCKRVDIFSEYTDIFLDAPYDTDAWRTLLSCGSRVILNRMLQHPAFDPLIVNPRTGTALVAHLIALRPEGNENFFLLCRLANKLKETWQNDMKRRLTLNFNPHFYLVEVLADPKRDSLDNLALFSTLDTFFDNVDELRQKVFHLRASTSPVSNLH
eukprot:TRINITY_DN1798_c0_g1_i2.p1 TRINITY_DN1798_c0_g1~~TRINITY_DN1798_c0_g1_i2.p1  ORF type:complete len:558 (+),score=52.45 TRINITY_DN1798_c0_g1_i2:267-1940(+)